MWKKGKGPGKFHRAEKSSEGLFLACMSLLRIKSYCIKDDFSCQEKGMGIASA
jgi:hypothetical protein